VLLLSIRPRFASAIYSKTKSFEFRRRPPRRSIPGLALIYETLPIARITGVVRILEAIALRPGEAEALAGPCDPFCDLYEAYVGGAAKPCALALDEPERLWAPMELSALTELRRPPQSFGYVALDPIALNGHLPSRSCHSNA
jgi:predicted transcriptional regulator